jgi:glycine cleavage system H protein
MFSRSSGRNYLSGAYSARAGNYLKQSEARQLIVIDGCSSRCASKIASKQGFKPVKRIFIPEEIKNKKVQPEKALRLGAQGQSLAEEIAQDLLVFLRTQTSCAGH